MAARQCRRAFSGLACSAAAWADVLRPDDAATCPPNCGPITPAAALSLRSHIVSQEHAQEIIARFRTSAAPGAVRAQSLDRSGVDALLAQPGAAGIRIHHARSADGGDTFVLYATDKDGRDLTQAAVNRTMNCPPTCSDPEEDPLPAMVEKTQGPVSPSEPALHPQHSPHPSYARPP